MVMMHVRQKRGITKVSFCRLWVIMLQNIYSLLDLGKLAGYLKDFCLAFVIWLPKIKYFFTVNHAFELAKATIIVMK